MIGRIAACLVSTASCFVLNAQDMETSRVLSSPIDTVRAAEIQDRVVLGRIKQHSREAQAREEFQRRQFEVRFNQLVDAVASFAKRYNEGHGTTWPQLEADRLRKAMGNLQSLEESLRGELGSAAQRQRTASAAR